MAPQGRISLFLSRALAAGARATRRVLRTRIGRLKITPSLSVADGFLLLARRALAFTPLTEHPVKIRGHDMVLGKRGYGYAVDYLTGEYERGTTALCESLLIQGMTVLDIGAHFGYYTLLAARSVGQSGKVYAFEPHPTNYELLLKNVALNGYENVVAVKKAVSDHSGTARLALVENSLQHCLFQDGARKRSSISVESTSLDEFLESVGSPEVHLIKMDIEGGEEGALRGMTRLIQGSRGPRLVMEYSPSNLEASGTDPLSVLRWLRESGFTIWAIDEKRGGLRPLGSGRAEASNLFCEK